MSLIERKAVHQDDVLLRLWRVLPSRRKRQFFLVIAAMFAGAFAEVLSLGAVLPFLTVIADPERVTQNVLVGPLLRQFGIVDRKVILLSLALVFAAASILACIVRVALAWATNKYVFTIGHDLGRKLYERVLNQPYSWHVARNTSDIIAAINDVQVVTGSMLLPLMQAATSCLIGAFIIVALLALNPMISLIAFSCFGLLYVAVSLFTRSTLRDGSRVIARSQGQRLQAVQEGLGGIRDVLLDNSQPVFQKRFEAVDSKLREAQATAAFIAAAPRFVVESSGMVVIAALACYLGLGENGLSTATKTLGVLALGAVRLMPLMQLVYNGWARVASNTKTLENLLAMIEAPVLNADREIAHSSHISFEHLIAFRCVSFRYAGERTEVLSSIDWEIPKGARVGILGKTGSGKSTLADLLMGLLEPTSGSVAIDGVALNEVTRPAWQRKIAHVPQAIFLADVSLAENIAFGVEPERIDRARVLEAARQAELASFIETLPQGYDTLVGERGVRLSGGQRQRIGIARALYKQADVLVLDEATSALDSETERAIMRAIANLSDELTIFIITHKHSILPFCKVIMSVEGGAIHAVAAPAGVIAELAP